MKKFSELNYFNYVLGSRVGQATSMIAVTLGLFSVYFVQRIDALPSGMLVLLDSSTFFGVAIEFYVSLAIALFATRVIEFGLIAMLIIGIDLGKGVRWRRSGTGLRYLIFLARFLKEHQLKLRIISFCGNFSIALVGFNN